MRRRDSKARRLRGWSPAAIFNRLHDKRLETRVKVPEFVRNAEGNNTARRKRFGRVDRQDELFAVRDRLEVTLGVPEEQFAAAYGFIDQFHFRATHDESDRDLIPVRIEK